jgi:putative hydrolase of the HAD superfamily
MHTDLKKKYKHIFFDLDHTLWDFDGNTTEAIKEIYDIYGFDNWSFSFNDFIKSFHEANNLLWNKFNHGLIDRLELRNTRFKMILGNLGISENKVPLEIGEKYLAIAPSKSKVLPYTYDVLDYLLPKYKLHIISNGFDDVQHRKMKASNIYHYFDKIITSDSSGHRKPQKEIFEYAMAQACASPADALFIGDNPDTDIQGAQNAQIDHIFYNPDNRRHSFSVTYEIRSLREIMKIL